MVTSGSASTITCEYTGLPLDTQGYLWIHRVTCGYTGLRVDTQGYVRIHRVTCGYAVDTQGYVWIHQGYVWIHTVSSYRLIHTISKDKNSTFYL